MRLLIIPLLFILITSLIAIIFGDRIEIPESYSDAVGWLRSYDDWAWVVATAVIIGDFVLPLPSIPALLGLGVIYGPLMGGIIGGLASTIAGILGFGITRLLGQRGALFLVGERDLARAEQFYKKWGVFAVVIGRAIGGPFEWLILIAGISGMPFTHVFLALLLGGFSASITMAWLGNLAVDNPAVALIFIILLASLLAWLGRKLLPPLDTNTQS